MARLVVGLLLLGVASVFLAWNEDRAAETAHMLAEGASAVVSATSERIDPANEGRLVHVSGEMRAQETLSDPQFGITRDAIKLIREVEMYQWRESSSGDGYERQWDARIIDSSRFADPAGHANPREKRFLGERYDDRTVTADDVTLGAFRLTRSQVDRLGRGMPLPLGSSIMERLPEAIRKHARAAGNHIYLGGDPGAPEIGELRVTFRIIEPGPASVVARQAGGALAPYRTGSGRAIELVALGERSAQAMFESVMGDNALWTWVLRVVGVLAMVLGLALVIKSVGAVTPGLPIIGRLAGADRPEGAPAEPSPATTTSDGPAEKEPPPDRRHEKLLMRAMITAARAANCKDEATKTRIARQAHKAGLTRRERMILKEEMAKPWTMDKLAAACADMREKMRLYAVSVMTVPPENPVGKAYLHQLALRLDLTPEHLAAVHERLGREAPASADGVPRSSTG